MKAAVISLDAVVALLLFSTLICGVWMANQPAVEASSVRFHMTIGIGTVVAAVVALSLSTYLAFQMR
jgi:cytochrome b561